MCCIYRLTLMFALFDGHVQDNDFLTRLLEYTTNKIVIVATFGISITIYSVDRSSIAFFTSRAFESHCCRLSNDLFVTRSWYRKF